MLRLSKSRSKSLTVYPSSTDTLRTSVVWLVKIKIELMSNYLRNLSKFNNHSRNILSATVNICKRCPKSYLFNGHFPPSSLTCLCAPWSFFAWYLTQDEPEFLALSKKLKITTKVTDQCVIVVDVLWNWPQEYWDRTCEQTRCRCCWRSKDIVSRRQVDDWTVLVSPLTHPV